MNILIISLPRTGSTELGKRLSIHHLFKYELEPFVSGGKLLESTDFNNTVLKTIIFHLPSNVNEDQRINWLVELSKKFNEVILLSRKNLISCAESWAYLQYNEKQKSFNSTTPYLWERTPNFDEEYKFIQKCNSELQRLSEKLNIPITYYEDIYDEKDSNRLRKGNRFDFSKKII
jgi:hypothetical protein